MGIIRRQGLHLSTVFGFINVIDLSSEIYRFEKVHFSNCLGLLRGLPGWKPSIRPKHLIKKSKLECWPSDKEWMFWKVHIDTFDKSTKMLKIVKFFIANFDPKTCEILVTFEIGVCTFSDPHTQNWYQFCTKTVFYLLIWYLSWVYHDFIQVSVVGFKLILVFASGPYNFLRSVYTSFISL